MLEYQEMAIRQFGKALDHSPSYVADRFKGSTALFALYSETKSWKFIYQAVCTIASLICQLTPSSLQDFDKQYQLMEAVSLASDATAVALMASFI